MPLDRESVSREAASFGGALMDSIAYVAAMSWVYGAASLAEPAWRRQGWRQDDAMLWTVARAKVYGERWRHGESLGEGAQGHAYYATRLSDDSKGWVIKVMRGSVSAGRFEQEIRALAGLNSPRIPRVEDYSVEGEDRHYVVRYLGLPLDEFLRARETPMEERLRIFYGSSLDSRKGQAVADRDDQS